MEKVQQSMEPLAKDNLIKMYFTENVVGKYYMEILEQALNNVSEKKYAPENKLKETIQIINSIE